VLSIAGGGDGRSRGGALQCPSEGMKRAGPAWVIRPPISLRLPANSRAIARIRVAGYWTKTGRPGGSCVRALLLLTTGDETVRARTLRTSSAAPVGIDRPGELSEVVRPTIRVVGLVHVCSSAGVVDRDHVLARTEACNVHARHCLVPVGVPGALESELGVRVRRQIRERRGTAVVRGLRSRVRARLGGGCLLRRGRRGRGRWNRRRRWRNRDGGCGGLRQRGRGRSRGDDLGWLRRPRRGGGSGSRARSEGSGPEQQCRHEKRRSG